MHRLVNFNKIILSHNKFLFCFILFIYFRFITNDDSEVERPQNPRNNANIFEIVTYR